MMTPPVSQLRALIVVFLLIFLTEKCSSGSLQEDITNQLDRERDEERFLSRKRRYLTFPEGSSFQVVFCLTYPSIGVGSIFVFGNTAALAWELPSTPIFFNYKDLTTTTTTTTEAPTTTEAWNIEDLVHDPHDYPDFHPENKDISDRYDNGNRYPVSTYNNPIFDYVYPPKFGHLPQRTGYLNQNIKYSPQKNEYLPGNTKYSHQKNEYSPQNIQYSPQKIYPSPNKEYSPQKDGYSSQKYGYSPQKLSNNVYSSQKYGNSARRYNYSPQKPQKNTNSAKFDNSYQDKSGYTKNYEKSNSYSRLSYQGDNRRFQVHPSSSYIDPIYHAVHRRTRRDLYGKLQQFLTTLNIDGKNCVLKAICEVNQKTREKGTFIEEIIKTIFRIKPVDGYPDEDHFDFASNKTHVCEDQYPSCRGSVFSNMFIFNKKH